MCVHVYVIDSKGCMLTLQNARTCMDFVFFYDMRVQMHVLATCVPSYESKIFIYLAETVFIAGNVDEFLVYFLTLPWCLLCLPGELWPVCLCSDSGHYIDSHCTLWNPIFTELYARFSSFNVMSTACRQLQCTMNFLLN